MTENIERKGPGRPPKYASAEERINASRAFCAVRSRAFRARRKALLDSLLHNAKLADEARTRKAREEIREVEARLDGHGQAAPVERTVYVEHEPDQRPSSIMEALCAPSRDYSVCLDDDIMHRHWTR